jgi:phosphoenolpyruvate---glycerone phosphotransferase subunit DhaL
MTLSTTACSGRALVIELVEAIEEHTMWLSEIDGAIGDGDHGVNLTKGFQLIKTRLGDDVISISQGLALIGKTLLTDIGGSMGPLYGTFFIQMSLASRDRDLADPRTFALMLCRATEEIADLGGAKVGDKTLMDVLVPAQDAYTAAIARGANLDLALREMVAAAERGRDSTRDLVAKLGRAARLGERSRGMLDAGACSCALILKVLARVFSRAR